MPNDLDLVPFISHVELWQAADHLDPETRLPVLRGGQPLASGGGCTVAAPRGYAGVAVLRAFASDRTELARWRVDVAPGDAVSVA